MLKIGLTGGMGSGKTTVAQIFEVLHIPVYYADQAARRLMDDDKTLKKAILENFGNDSYFNGKLNRAFLAEAVFNDPSKLSLLNSLVHPVTIADGEAWMQELRRSLNPPPYVLKEAALVFESGLYKQLDYVIGVSSPENLRIQRAMQRDKLTEQQVRLRMKQQMDEADKMSKCDFVLHNNETELLIPQVVRLHRQLAELSKQGTNVN